MRSKIVVIFTLLVCFAMLGGVFPGSHVVAKFKDTLRDERDILNKATSGEWPYKEGGSDPSGFDSAGFVQYMCNYWKWSGKVTLPRTATEQYEQGTPVDQSNLLPGDLVFFEKNGKVDSVGIVWLRQGENCYFLTVTKKDGSTPKSLNMPYWKKHFYGAKRIIQPSEKKSALIQHIYTLAQRGELLGCEFGLGTKKETITEKWGQPDFTNSFYMEYREKGVTLKLNGDIVSEISMAACPIGDLLTNGDIIKVIGWDKIPSFTDIPAWKCGQYMLYDSGRGYTLSYAQGETDVLASNE